MAAAAVRTTARTTAANTSWTIAEVIDVFPALRALALRHGYVVAICGSVLSGVGRDLDLVLIPLADRTSDASGLAIEFGGQVVRRSVDEARGVRSYEVEKDGHLYHWIFGKFYGGGNGKAL